MMILYRYTTGPKHNEISELQLLQVKSKTYDDYYIRSETGAIWIATKEFTLKEFKGEITMKEARETYPEYFL